jgi:hypothetical protein
VETSGSKRVEVNETEFKGIGLNNNGFTGEKV